MSKRKSRMPGAARTGIGLLVMGGIISGVGQYYQRDVVALYGLAIVAGGFILYMVSSIYAKRTGR